MIIENASMKKLVMVGLVLMTMVGLVGCNKRSMNYIIEHEPSIMGIVEEAYDNYMVIYVKTDEYPNGVSCKVSLNVENNDSYTNVSIGDEVVVYYDGNISESDPLQIDKVYAITLRTPAKQKMNRNLMIAGKNVKKL